ncbi:MAG: hypothetical protein NZ869_03025 [Thermoanaerobaculum sp.]|nr:hypothetical protein [Thermoanaerobaculum sp.]MDW7967253.1 hypothetical protein [Thermoanaerobaculum sp.]
MRWRGLRVFAQAVKQEIADLQRHGLEVEVAWRFPLPGFVLSGDQPVVNRVQPAVRFSEIENEFFVPSGFFAPSLAWDWQKWDVGIRVGILSGLDITLEYARHDMEFWNGRSLHPDDSAGAVLGGATTGRQVRPFAAVAPVCAWSLAFHIGFLERDAQQ